MAQDIFNTCTPDAFREMCKAHHVSSWMDRDSSDNETHEIIDSDSLETHKPPPFQWSAEYVEKLKMEQRQHRGNGEEEDSPTEKARDRKSYSSVAKTQKGSTLGDYHNDAVVESAISTSAVSKKQKTYSNVSSDYNINSSSTSTLHKIANLRKSVSLKKVKQLTKQKSVDFLKTHNAFSKIEAISEDITDKLRHNISFKSYKNPKDYIKEKLCKFSNRPVSHNRNTNVISKKSHKRAKIKKNTTKINIKTYWHYFMQLVNFCQVVEEMYHRFCALLNEIVIYKIILLYLIIYLDLWVMSIWLYITFKFVIFIRKMLAE